AARILWASLVEQGRGGPWPEGLLAAGSQAGEMGSCCDETERKLREGVQKLGSCWPGWAQPGPGSRVRGSRWGGCTRCWGTLSKQQAGAGGAAAWRRGLLQGCGRGPQVGEGGAVLQPCGDQVLVWCAGHGGGHSVTALQDREAERQGWDLLRNQALAAWAGGGCGMGDKGDGRSRMALEGPQVLAKPAGGG
ncbi:hypothetical protein HaLaN_31623, partial [Haematococcus lacustris]